MPKRYLFIIPYQQEKERGVPAFRTRNTEAQIDVLPLQSPAVDVTLDGGIFFGVDGKRINFDIYDRYVYLPWNYSPQYSLVKDIDKNHQFSDMLFEQWYSISLLLEERLRSKSCVNPPHRARRLCHKPTFLSIASDYGIHTPQTIFSNVANEVSRFFQNKPFVEKVAGFHNTLPGGMLMPTTKRLPDELLQNEELVQQAPSCFQELLDRRTEKRVYVFRKTVVVLSQKLPSNSVLDTRFADANDIIFEIEAAPEEISVPLTKICKDFGVDFCAFDFMQCRESEPWVALEANPHGQWDWIPRSRIRKQIEDEFLNMVEI